VRERSPHQRRRRCGVVAQTKGVKIPSDLDASVAQPKPRSANSFVAPETRATVIRRPLKDGDGHCARPAPASDLTTTVLLDTITKGFEEAIPQDKPEDGDRRVLQPRWGAWDPSCPGSCRAPRNWRWTPARTLDPLIALIDKLRTGARHPGPTTAGAINSWAANLANDHQRPTPARPLVGGVSWQNGAQAAERGAQSSSSAFSPRCRSCWPT